MQLIGYSQGGRFSHCQASRFHHVFLNKAQMSLCTRKSPLSFAYINECVFVCVHMCLRNAGGPKFKEKPDT